MKPATEPGEVTVSEIEVGGRVEEGAARRHQCGGDGARPLILSVLETGIVGPESVAEALGGSTNVGRAISSGLAGAPAGRARAGCRLASLVRWLFLVSVVVIVMRTAR